MSENSSPRTVQTGFEAFNASIGSAMKSLEKIKARGMDEYGLSGTYTLCLRQLYDCEAGLTRTELSVRCCVDRAQITRVIGDLLDKGLVQEKGNGSNYRKRCVLTEEGRKTTGEINDLVARILNFVSGDIPQERLTIFYETLREICEKLKKAEDMV